MGNDVLSQREAWSVYEQLARDPRIVFALEPPDIEPVWKKLTQGGSRAAGYWTDAYIAALALLHSFQVVSFDRGFRGIMGLDSTIL